MVCRNDTLVLSFIRQGSELRLTSLVTVCTNWCKIYKLFLVILHCVDKYSLTVAQAMIEMMRLRSRQMPNAAFIFSVEAAGQV